jgi:hypothetical protein
MHVEDYATPDEVDSAQEVTFAADVRESLEAFGVHLSIFTVQKHHDYVVVGTTVGNTDPVMYVTSPTCVVMDGHWACNLQPSISQHRDVAWSTQAWTCVGSSRQ